MADTDGNAYLVYHIKYDDGTIQHNVEVHRLVKAAEGEDSWYLVAPFQKSDARPHPYGGDRGARCGRLERPHP